MNTLPITPSQTVGPFFAYGLTARQYGYDYTSLMDGILIEPRENQGKIIYITGCIIDGNGNTVSDAIVELWQADEQGQYAAEPIAYPPDHSTFTGFGRFGTGTTANHEFLFTTIKPGVTEEDAAPHINVILFMRGSLRTLYTRLYFSDETEANGRDTFLNSIDPNRRSTLLATKRTDGHYQFDIRLQGAEETVFFDL
jgi:protocatechuate 3,4-dioxygenase alpha subunit